MTNMINAIQRELAKRIEEAGFKEVTITMKINGDEITITPCGYNIEKWDDIDYFLLDSQKLNLCGDGKLEKVAATIADYDKLLEEDAKALENLKAHIRKYGENADWDFVSDYHKDIFGHRPHVSHSQIIDWAHSKSKASARYYE